MFCFENYSKTKTVSSQHSWSKVFEQGLSYTEDAEAKFQAAGLKELVTLSRKETSTNSGFYRLTETLSSNRPCVAQANTQVVCTYMAYRGEINTGYTIHWKDGSTTRGKYKGEGWHLDTVIQTSRL